MQIATAIIVNGKSAAEVAADIRASRYAQTYSALADALETMGADKTRGQLYTVDIPEDSEMLDWDKPLSEQPEGCGRRLSGACQTWRRSTASTWAATQRSWTIATDRPIRHHLSRGFCAWSNNGTSNFGLTQKDVDRMLGSRDVDDLKGQQIYTRLAAQRARSKQPANT